ncbi:hypothetical protein SSX86_030625 [Deinandra increscens subsp. villosa]|uniref:Translation initiation factor 5A C-terminal domain-containing protein n=1 Tax=Deinandra increscens subsp. villosa TaxID=3103831 RepID=A0AAP0CAJ3_9ASTR
MSDEEHQFESKADAGASKTYPQQAGTIRKGGHIVIKNRACKVVEVSTSKTGKHGHAKCHFVAIDIFNGKKLEDIVPSSHNCDVSLLTENGNTKDDLKLPTDDALLTQIKDGFAEGKDLVVSVMSAMGEEQICALKDIGPNFPGKASGVGISSQNSSTDTTPIKEAAKMKKIEDDVNGGRFSEFGAAADDWSTIDDLMLVKNQRSLYGKKKHVAKLPQSWASKAEKSKNF